MCEAKVTVYKEVTMIRGRPHTWEETSCTTLSSRGTPYWVCANSPNRTFYVQMLGKYRKADQLFSVPRRIVSVLSINCLSQTWKHIVTLTLKKNWSSLLPCAYTYAGITVINCLIKDYLFPVKHLGKDDSTVKAFSKMKQQLWRSQVSDEERGMDFLFTYSFYY